MSRAPRFWLRGDASVEAAALFPVAAIWSAIAARRMRQPRAVPPRPLICIGNFTVGGAGKTPLAEHVCRLLIDRGLDPAILSRGYGGSLSGKNPLRVDPATHKAEQVGDEPLLLARTSPVYIGVDRRASSALAAAEGARTLVMDDGFQSASLAADVSLVAADGAIGVGNGRVMPAGPLRAPLDAQWAFVSALVVFGDGEAGRRLCDDAARRGKPAFQARLTPDSRAAAQLSGQRVLAFAGIGRPDKFFATLETIGVDVAARRSFADHHRYTARDIARLAAEATAIGARRLLTTEKDLVRLAGLGGIAADLMRRGELQALPVRVEFDARQAFAAWLEAHFPS